MIRPPHTNYCTADVGCGTCQYILASARFGVLFDVEKDVDLGVVTSQLDVHNNISTGAK